jgi:hypothetical protein
LSFDSDFAAFMKPDVDATLRRQALKTLLNDPRFNVMDGLDVYIDDYSLADPLPEGWIAKLNQYARLGNHEPAANDPPQEVPRQEEPVQVVAGPEPRDPAAAGSVDDAGAPAGDGVQGGPGSDTSTGGSAPARLQESREE